MNKDLLNSSTDGNTWNNMPAQFKPGANNNMAAVYAIKQTLSGPDGVNSVVVNERRQEKCGCKGKEIAYNNVQRELTPNAIQQMRQFYKKM